MADEQNEDHGSRLGINLDAVDCPQCGHRMPVIRMPESVHQLLWGGWSCPNCGRKMDKWGKAIEPDA